MGIPRAALGSAGDSPHVGFSGRNASKCANKRGGRPRYSPFFVKDERPRRGDVPIWRNSDPVFGSLYPVAVSVAFAAVSLRSECD
ncbi:hypothetical protein HN011_006254 [Eciton burchellii]|nr:hypothetical protein HN011_006254 [Eciton burchellii]